MKLLNLKIFLVPTISINAGSFYKLVASQISLSQPISSDVANEVAFGSAEHFSGRSGNESDDGSADSVEF